MDTLTAEVATYTDNDLVTDNNQNLLMNWQHIFLCGQFSIGDIAAYEVDRATAEGKIVTNKRIFSAIGRFCGKSARTVRYYYETAIFYPAEVRDQYEMLPFSHFVYARGFGDEWQSVLDYARDHGGITEFGLRVAFEISSRWQRDSLETDAEENPPSAQNLEKVYTAENGGNSKKDGWYETSEEMCEGSLNSHPLSKIGQTDGPMVIKREVRSLLVNLVRVAALLPSMSLKKSDLDELLTDIEGMVERFRSILSDMV